MTDEVAEKAEVPEFVGSRPRSRRIELEDHIKFRGKVYTALNVVRMRASEVSAWVEAVKAGDTDRPLGNVLDDDGEVVPKEVLDFLDDDADLQLSEALDDFLPRRLSEALDSEPKT